jgi:hypothetical protein
MLTDRTSEPSGRTQGTAAAGDCFVILFPESRALWAAGPRAVMIAIVEGEEKVQDVKIGGGG